MNSMNATLGLCLFVSGAIWLRRGMRDEVHPDAPTSLFAPTEVQSDKDRRWKLRLGVFNLIVGGVYFLSAIFRY